MSATNNKRIVQPYLFFNGVCEQALAFYRKAAGVEVTKIIRYKDSPEPAMCPPGSGDKVLHASCSIGETTLLASTANGPGARCSGNGALSRMGLSRCVPAHAGNKDVAWCEA